MTETYIFNNDGYMEKASLDEELIRDNSRIKEGILEYYDNQTDEYLFKIIKTMQELLLQEKHLLIPVDVKSVVKESDETLFSIRNIITDDGSNCAVAFTDMENVLMGADTDILSNNIAQFLESIVDMDEVDGILINPWGGRSLYLSKFMMQFILEVNPIENISYKRLNKLTEKAIIFATEKHKGQVRKGTTIPYITHCLDVMQLLQRMEADKNVIIAGILHDTLEDTNTSWEELVEKFGTDVANLVAEHTQDESLPWEEKRQKFIDSLDTASLRLKKLVLADKLANLQSMFRDHNKIGDSLWKRFKAPKEKIAWYYSEVQDKLFQLQKSVDTAPYYWEMVAIFKDLFVSYWFNGKDKIYQKCDNGQCYILTKESLVWKKFEDKEITDHLDLIPRFQAEIIENQWRMEHKPSVINKKVM